MGITEIWTIIAIVLKLCGVGSFANWDIIAWPWHWSCLCIELWSLMIYFAIFAAVIIYNIIMYILVKRHL